MDADNFKKWLDLAQQFQSEHFWNQIFDDQKQGNLGKAKLENPFSTVSEITPKCDLYEMDKELILEAEIPGLDKDDLHISIQKQNLTISGEFRSLKPKGKYFLKERVNRKFKKEITLPYPVLINKTKIEIRKGILMMVMPLNADEAEDIPIHFDAQETGKE